MTPNTAMILAAGRGERMRPLTDHTPKPLLQVGGKPLIVWHLERLAHAGYTRIVVNHAHLGAQIEAALGDGAAFGVSIAYSRETVALETAGGIATALPLLDADVFAVVNGDIYTDYDFKRLAAPMDSLAAGHARMHLVLVDNPPQHPDGDFALLGAQLRLDADAGHGLPRADTVRLTFSGIGLYHRKVFANIAPRTRAPLAPLLRATIADGAASGEHHRGCWVDVGTPERLQRLDAVLRNSNAV